MQTAAKQLGVGVLGMITILVLIGGFAALTIKLVPHFIEHMSVIRALENVEQATLIESKFKIYENLQKRFKIEYIYDKPQTMVTIDKDRHVVTFHVKYERQDSIMGPVGVYVHFEEDVVRPITIAQ